jgi:hypothetical protein
LTLKDMITSLRAGSTSTIFGSTGSKARFGNHTDS